MPYIHTRLTQTLSPEKEERLKARFGQAIRCFPGKSEQWLMADFTDQCRLWFQGSRQNPLAIVQVDLFGSAPDSAYDHMTAELTKILAEELVLDPACIYIKYTEFSHWGWNGNNF